MAVTVEIPFQGNVLVPRDPETVRTYLTDWETSVPDNFPGLESFEPVGDGAYRWTFEKLSYQTLEATIVLVTRFEDDPEEIDIVPVAADTPHELEGRWKLRDRDGETELSLTVTLNLELPIPRLMKGVATPIARKEIGKLMQNYLENVAKHLSE